MNVFIIPVHVKPVGKTILPDGFSGAYVSCYSPGNDYVDTVKNVLKRLAKDGFFVEEILEPILQMQSESWEFQVVETWPEYVEDLPSPIEFEAAMKEGQVIYGPFGSY